MTEKEKKRRRGKQTEEKGKWVLGDQERERENGIEMGTHSSSGVKLVALRHESNGAARISQFARVTQMKKRCHQTASADRKHMRKHIKRNRHLYFLIRNFDSAREQNQLFFDTMVHDATSSASVQRFATTSQGGSQVQPSACHKYVVIRRFCCVLETQEEMQSGF